MSTRTTQGPRSRKPGSVLRGGMTTLLRLGPAACVGLVLMACGEAPPPAVPSNLSTPTIDVALAPLQIATGSIEEPAAPAFIHCEGLSARSADTLFCFDTARRTWQEAEEHCRLIGGHLADIRSTAEASVLRAGFGMPITLPPTLWIGLVEPFREGEWGWMSGKVASYQNWQAGEPNNAGGEDCGERLSSNGRWNDIDCGASRSFLCEDPAAPAPKAGAGQKTAATSKYGFACSGTLIDAGGTSYCLYANYPLTAADADQFCKAKGGRLAEPSSVEKDDALREQLGPRAGTGEDVWLGLTDARREGFWETPTRDLAAFTAWRAGEPNNVGPSGEDCATWGPGDGQWNDVPCDIRAQSICRGTPEPARAAE